MVEMTIISSDRVSALPAGHGAFSTIIALKTPAQGEIYALQEAFRKTLEPEFRPALLPHLPSAAHSTLDSIVDPTRQDLEHEEIFREGLPIYRSVLDEIAADTAPFDITFDQVHTHADSIIIVAEDTDGRIQKIRNRFRKRVKELASARVDDARRRVPQDIVHYTTTRCRKAIPLEIVKKAVEPHHIFFTQKVSAVHIVRSTNMALEPYTTVSTHQLQGTR